MEIIEKGLPKVHHTYECTCRECRSVLRFRRDEAEFRSDQRDGDYLTINCPVCKEAGITTPLHVAADKSLERAARDRSRPSNGGWL